MDSVETAALGGARVVTTSGIVEGGVRLEGGTILDVAEGLSGDLGGDFLVPGIVDVHTDHVEKHLVPRSSTTWDPLTAAMAHDAQMIGGGTTTVFDSLCVGASLKNPRRRELLGPALDALETASAEGMLRAEHLVHLRCEITDPETPALVAANIDRPIVRMASVMDHTPGDRQSPDIARWTDRMARDIGLTDAEAIAARDDLMARHRTIAPRIRAEVAAQVTGRGLPLMSHDDARPEHIHETVAEGGTISEFPTTVVAAEAARAAGLLVVAGAPNYLRGGSQSGNVAVAELLSAGLVDLLASDYVPRAPLDAAFALAADGAMAFDLPGAVRLVTSAPARAAGLADRGEIAPGQRADLVQVRLVQGRAVVRRVWVQGRRVL